MKKMIMVLSILVLLVSTSSALTLDELVENIQANQSRIQDIYAETTTTIVSDMKMPGSKSKGPNKIVQKGRMWSKGSDKSKIEMLSPTKQITITNGSMMAIIDPVSGQKIVRDLDEMPGMQMGKSDRGKVDLEKIKEYFTLSLKEKDGFYVIKGIPKQSNQFLGKMEFYVDPTRWVPTKILMYNGRGKLISQIEMQYDYISDIWVPVKNVSNIMTPMGKMEVEMVYENVKVNEGISDKEFEVE